ncbi:MAG: helix-turn-helix transcriptional regulator [Bacteroidota bacterium]
MLDNPPIYLPQNIRFLRKNSRLSQEELATRVGLNRGNIASYEKGIAEPKLCNLLKIANLFKISLKDLTGRDLSTANKKRLTKHNDSNGHLAHLEEEKLGKYLEKAEELQMVASSLYNCHCFKLKNIEIKDKNTQALVSNFEQLYEVTHNLLHSHQELLKLVKKENSLLARHEVNGHNGAYLPV